MNMHSLLRVEPKTEGVVAEPVAEEIDPAGATGFDICGSSEEPDIPTTQGKPQIHLNPYLNFCKC